MASFAKAVVEKIKQILHTSFPNFPAKPQQAQCTWTHLNKDLAKENTKMIKLIATWRRMLLLTLKLRNKKPLTTRKLQMMMELMTTKRKILVKSIFAILVELAIVSAG